MEQSQETPITFQEYKRWEEVFNKFAVKWNKLSEDVQLKSTADRKHGLNYAMDAVIFMKHHKDGLLNFADHWAFMQDKMADADAKYGGGIKITEEENRPYYDYLNTITPGFEGVSFDDMINMEFHAAKMQSAGNKFAK